MSARWPFPVRRAAATLVLATLAVLADNVRPHTGQQHAGHIFNLGHGVQPNTDPGVLAAVVDLVHERTRA